MGLRLVGSSPLAARAADRHHPTAGYPIPAPYPLCSLQQGQPLSASLTEAPFLSSCALAGSLPLAAVPAAVSFAGQG
jgi:hypothetical protein